MRQVTSLLAITVCVLAGIRGFDVAQFTNSDLAGEHANSKSVESWAATQGVSAMALADWLHHTARATDADMPYRRTVMLTRLLAVRPLSSSDWLSLAGMALVTGQRSEAVHTALGMSSITGPNEGGTMWERGAFGLLQWDGLPETARRRTAIDLAGPTRDGLVGDREIAPIKSILSGKSPEARSQIAALLASEGVSRTTLARMGL